MCVCGGGGVGVWVYMSVPMLERESVQMMYAGLYSNIYVLSSWHV